VLAGLGLKTEEFSQAFKRLGFNAFVQVFNFGFLSAVVFGFTRFLISVNWINEDLAAGMVVCSCLPMAINIVIVLTASAGGDEAAAIFNTTFGNILGIFLSPALILGYLGSSSDIALVDIFYKLSLRVVLPLAVGQLLQKFSPPVVAFAAKHKRRFKKIQEFCLVFIVYTVFCKTFESGERNAGLGDVFLMILFQFLLMISLMTVAWYSLGFAFPNQPRSRVMGLFGCTMKTVALGIPMINSIYENDPNMGLYALPLLIWHPMQLVIGTILTPRLSAYIEKEEKRLEDEKEEEKRVNYDHSQTVLSAKNDEEEPPSNDVEAPVNSKEETATNEEAV
jgi:sodium/bile acid cotransporter 7